MKITILIPPSLEGKVETVIQTTHYCPGDTVYLMTEEANRFLVTSIGQHKRELQMKQERYENVLKGLRYWQQRATNAESSNTPQK